MKLVCRRKRHCETDGSFYSTNYYQACRPPVDGEDVSVPLPEPGHGLVVEVVHLALQVGHAPRLGREHQVCRQQQLTLPGL